MGYHNLELITSKLITLGKKKIILVQLFQKGQQKSKSSCWNFKNIVEKSYGLETPVMIVIGEVVNLKKKSIGSIFRQNL